MAQDRHSVTSGAATQGEISSLQSQIDTIQTTPGPQGPAGPAPSGTGYVHVTAGVLDTPAATATPTAHSHAPGDTTGTAIIQNDSRLSDARTPVAHTHAAGDVTGTAVLTADSRLSDARAPTAHVHAESDVTNLITDLAAKANQSFAVAMAVAL